MRRVHATTGEIPAERLIIERARSQMLPAPYARRPARSLIVLPRRKRVLGYQLRWQSKTR
jgi:hypothetical protein